MSCLRKFIITFAFCNPGIFDEAFSALATIVSMFQAEERYAALPTHVTLSALRIRIFFFGAPFMKFHRFNFQRFSSSFHDRRALLSIVCSLALPVTYMNALLF